MNILTKYSPSPIDSTLLLIVFHGPMSICAKFDANLPVDGAFMAK